MATTDRLTSALADRYRIERQLGQGGMATVTTGAKSTIGERRTVSIGESFDDATHAGYDVASDGQLLLLRPTESAVRGVIVHSWGRVLREKLALDKK